MRQTASEGKVPSRSRQGVCEYPFGRKAALLDQVDRVRKVRACHTMSAFVTPRDPAH